MLFKHLQTRSCESLSWRYDTHCVSVCVCVCPMLKLIVPLRGNGAEFNHCYFLCSWWFQRVGVVSPKEGWDNDRRHRERDQPSANQNCRLVLLVLNRTTQRFCQSSEGDVLKFLVHHITTKLTINPFMMTIVQLTNLHVCTVQI